MKTITYNPETHVLVPREPREEMQAAKEAGMAVSIGGNGYWDHKNQIERFAAIIEKHTIERCAEVCDGFANSHYDQQMIAAMNCAAAIRKLGEQ